jgi:hypothetical protein
VGRGSSRARHPGRPIKGSVDLCGRGHDRLQLICMSLGGCPNIVEEVSTVRRRFRFSYALSLGLALALTPRPALSQSSSARAEAAQRQEEALRNDGCAGCRAWVSGADNTTIHILDLQAATTPNDWSMNHAVFWVTLRARCSS